MFETGMMVVVWGPPVTVALLAGIVELTIPVVVVILTLVVVGTLAVVSDTAIGDPDMVG